jgi:uncharacterized DUF497 family protein
MRFEWNEAKRRANLAKHGVDFADAVGVFYDPASITLEDAGSHDEARFSTLGRSYTDRVLVVVWVERDADVLRIISARKASPGEASHYEG